MGLVLLVMWVEKVLTGPKCYVSCQCDFLFCVAVLSSILTLKKVVVRIKHFGVLTHKKTSHHCFNKYNRF